MHARWILIYPITMHVVRAWSPRRQARRLGRLQDVLMLGEATSTLIDTLAYYLRGSESVMCRV